MQKLFFTIVLVVLMLAGGCASDSGSNVPVLADLTPSIQAQPPETDSGGDLEYHILAGEMAAQRGLRKRAAEEYVAALAFSADPALARRATRVAVFAEAPELAFKAARAWAKADPEAVAAHKTAARLALRADDKAALKQYAAQVVARAEAPGAGLRALADVLSGEPEHMALALNTMTELVMAHPDLAAAHYARALLALRYEDFNTAGAAIDRTLTLEPDHSEAQQLSVAILVRQDRIDAARTRVDDFTGTPAERSRHYMTFAQLLLEADREAAAADAFERAVAADPSNSDARYGLAVLALSLDRIALAEKTLTELYEAGDRADDAAFYLGNIAENRGDLARARRWYQRVDGGNRELDARVRAARVRYQRGDLAGARKELAALRDNHPELAQNFYAAEGQLLYEAERYDAALALYDKALQQHPNDGDLLYGRSLIHERLGDIDSAEADLRAVLDANPDDSQALNALGYMLTNHSQRYQEAFEYIQRALQAQPDAPAVMDSMGWVQYRLGNLPAARGHLQRAYQEFPDPEVAAHLGEVLWMLGEQARAREIWQEALAENPEHSTLRETVERLTP